MNGCDEAVVLASYPSPVSVCLTEEGLRSICTEMIGDRVLSVRLLFAMVFKYPERIEITGLTVGGVR